MAIAVKCALVPFLLLGAIAFAPHPLKAQELPPGPVAKNELPPGAPMMVNGKRLQGVAPASLLAPDDSDWSGDGELVPAGAVRVVNRATAKLGFSFYDMAEWKVVRLEPSRHAEIGCDRCEAIVHVQFHDGRSAKRFTLDLEREYVIGWSNRAGSWVLKEAE